MPYKGKRIIVVMPAYNAEKTLRECYDALPKEWVDHVILVDDRSSDRTVEVAKGLPIEVIVHERNTGYGGNQKTCYRAAKDAGGDIAVMVHPDHQYDPKFIPEMIRAMVDDGHRVVFGSRMMVRKNALAGGMPRWKYIANIALTKLGNAVLGTDLTEFHSGFRAYATSIFDEIDIEQNSDNFVFDTEIIIQMVSRDIPIKEVPISTRYFDEASQIALGPSVEYGLSILHNLFKYRTGIRKY